MRINENYLQLQGSYLFSEIAKRVKNFQSDNPGADIIRMGIGDVTRPLAPAVIEAMHKAVEDMASADTFKGYGPDYGYSFLIEKIIDVDFKSRGVDLDISEVFISDGAKCDVANIQEIFSQDSAIAVTDPVYPVYVDTNVMAGRSGQYLPDEGRFSKIQYLACNAENGFVPELPLEPADVIYLCYPNNPTGTTLSKEQLKVWVDYARENKAVIVFDAAYEAYISSDAPHSIYEIEGAKEVAIELRSMSKTAGFTGTRLAYAVVPKTLFGFDSAGNKVSLNALWARRQATKFNGCSYITQRGAEAVFTEEGQKQIRETVAYYMKNAAIIREGVEDIGLTAFGGVDAPYIWVKTPGIDSWQFFDRLLHEVNIVGTPGSGFGKNGEGYFRLTAFNTLENTLAAVERLKKLRL
ncbi:MAG: LL-diaminopimelate aminotransferase [Christensenellales bacterium]|jgi:LL-diaminopimelate aminotransferase